jgi:hypothetical protein
VPDWPSVYWHAEEKIAMAVYVDDFIVTGLEKAARDLMSELAKDVDMDPPLLSIVTSDVGIRLNVVGRGKIW